MLRVTDNLPDFQGVNAGGTAFCNVPVGVTYHAVNLEYKRSGAAATVAQMKSDLSAIRVKINGVEKIEASATQLIAIAEQNGITVTDGVLPVFFSRPWQRTPSGEDALAYGTADVNTMAIEVDIASGATSPTLTSTAETSAPTKLGTHMTLRRFSRDAAGAGTFQEQNLPRGKYGLIALHFDTDAISKMTIKAGGKQVVKAPTATLKSRDANHGKTWQTGMTHINFAYTDRLEDALSLNVQDFLVEAEMTGAATFSILQEQIEMHAA